MRLRSSFFNLKTLAQSLIALLVLSLYGCNSAQNNQSVQNNQLAVNYEIVSGKCFFQNSWIPVAGRLISWEIKSFDGISIKSHDWRRLTLGSSKNDYGLGDPKYFEIKSTFQPEEKSFVEKKKKELKVKGQVDFAQIIYSASELNLHHLNKLEDKNPFNRDSSNSFLVPGEHTICELNREVLMRNAIVSFKKKLFRKLEIISDKTVPVADGEPTFGVKVLQNIY
jgi:hypothetical protein